MQEEFSEQGDGTIDDMFPIIEGKDEPKQDMGEFTFRLPPYMREPSEVQRANSMIMYYITQNQIPYHLDQDGVLHIIADKKERDGLGLLVSGIEFEKVLQTDNVPNRPRSDQLYFIS